MLKDQGWGRKPRDNSEQGDVGAIGGCLPAKEKLYTEFVSCEEVQETCFLYMNNVLGLN